MQHFLDQRYLYKQRIVVDAKLDPLGEIESVPVDRVATSGIQLRAELRERVHGSCLAIWRQKWTYLVWFSKYESAFRVLQKTRAFAVSGTMPSRLVLRCAASLKQGQLGREQVFELARSCSECCRFCTTEPSNSTSTSTVTAPFARKVDAPSNVAATLLVDTLKLMKQFEEHGMF
jgi:hypothetical protein